MTHIITILHYFIEYILPTLSNIIIGCSAATTAFFAWKGLSIWKNQYKAKNNHELARRLLISIYEYRDAIRYIRNPVVIYTPKTKQEAPDRSEKERLSDAEYDYYQKGFDAIRKVYREIYASILEAEAVWGDELSETISKILSLSRKLKRIFRDHLHDKGHQGGNYEPFATSDDDQFTKDLDALIVKAENYLKKKLI